MPLTTHVIFLAVAIPIPITLDNFVGRTHCNFTLFHRFADLRLTSGRILESRHMPDSHGVKPTDRQITVPPGVVAGQDAIDENPWVEWITLVCGTKKSANRPDVAVQRAVRLRNGAAV